MLSKIQDHVAQFVLMSSPSVHVCVCVHVPFPALVCDSVRCALWGVHTCGCVCGHPVSHLVIRGESGLRLAQQGVTCVCVSVHTLHPSQLPHMSTPHHVPVATAAITVSKERANSFITRSTRALMTP